MKTLGLVPARGGSKGIPKKNIVDCAGKPLIAWTIEKALHSNLDHTIVSTDDKEIAHVAKEYGADVPFLRPKEVSGDETSMFETIKWTYDNYPHEFDAIMILQPTCPTRKTRHIDEALEIFTENRPSKVIPHTSLVSVEEVPVKYNPEWLFVEEDKYLRVCNGKPLKDRMTRRQDFPPAYQTNGAIYLFWTDLLDEGNFYGNRPMKYLMDGMVSIDTIEDLLQAEKQLKYGYGTA